MLGRMSFSVAERARLARTLLEVGPDSLTLCDGWATRDLAAHLWLRERAPFAVPGMFIPALASFTERAMAVHRARPFDLVVREWGSGPTGLWRYLDRSFNVTEHFVHHEDVRRPLGLSPRSFSTPEATELYSALRAMSFSLRRSNAVVELWPQGFLPITAGEARSSNRVQIHGPVGELILYLFDRPALELDFVGDVRLVRRMSW